MSHALEKSVAALILLAALAPFRAAASNGIDHRKPVESRHRSIESEALRQAPSFPSGMHNGDAVTDHEMRTAALACNEIATLRANVEELVREACEGMPSSAQVRAARKFTECFGDASINGGTITIDSGHVTCGNLDVALPSGRPDDGNNGSHDPAKRPKLSRVVQKVNQSGLCP